jgi:ComEC/Rec2-related protein
MSYMQFSGAGPAIWTGLTPMLTIAAGAAGILCRRALPRAGLFAICGLALFAGRDGGLRDFYQKMETAAENHQIMTLTVRISSPVASPPAHSGHRFRAKVINAEDAGVDWLLRGKTLQLMSRAPVPAYGTITVRGRYALPRPAAGPLGYDQREHFAINNIHGSFSVSGIISGNDDMPPLLTDKISHILRARVQRVINLSPSPDTRAILHAAFLDEREHLTGDLRTVLRKSGVVHMLAISGFHAALLYTAVFTLLGLLGLPPRPRRILSLAALWGYLFFIGFIPSLFRTTVMATFVCASLMLQRKNHVVHTLGVSGFFWLCLSPHSLFAPGFQLSFAATAGIVLMPQVFEGITKAVNMKIRNKPLEFINGRLLASFWVSVAATITTAPTLLHHFGMISIYGILYNMIAIPLMAVAMWAFFAALTLSFLPINVLAKAAMWCAETALELMTGMAGPSKAIPLSEVVVPGITGLQLFVMSIFMVGLCVVGKKLRGSYALRAGAVMALITGITALWASTQKTTEYLEFSSRNSTVNVIIHPDNNAWIIAQGQRNEIRNLRLREVEPLLYRKGIRDVPLLIINENAEAEAHEFAFSTGMTPRTVVIKNRRGDAQSGENENYTRVDALQIINATRSCSLKITPEGMVKINAQQ